MVTFKITKMMNTQINLSDEKFKEIYTDDRFLHDCAFPVDCCDARGFHKFYRTCTYPIEYIIMEEQIAVAKVEFARRRQAFLDGYKKGTLVLVCMGMDYPSKYPDGIANHRVRGEFKNSAGRHFFVEFCRSVNFGKKDDTEEVFYCDYSIDRDAEKAGRSCRNAFNLERGGRSISPYTKQRVLELVNTTFSCNYRELVLDKWLIRTDDLISEC